jgi:hypothetical protein
MSMSPQPDDHDGTDPLSAEAPAANDEADEEHDTDLLEPRFASGPSLHRPPTVGGEDQRGQVHAPPSPDDDLASEDAEETPPADGLSPAQESMTAEPDAEPHPSSETSYQDPDPADSESPADGAEATAGDAETQASTSDTLPDDPADETSPASTEEALADEDGRAPADEPADDSTVTGTALPEEPVNESLDASGSDEEDAPLSEDQALLDDDDIFTFQAFEEDPEDASTSPGMTTSTADEPEPTGTSVQFQQGSGGYAGVIDTFLYEGQPRANRANQKTLTVDSEERRGEMQALVRFTDIFGDDAGQIPLGATILSATLELQTTTAGDGATLHRMLQPWSDSDTWDSLQNGIQADGVEALAQADLETGFITAGTTRLDVTTSLQAWADGQVNFGWAFLPLGPDGWSFDSAEGTTPPKLVVEYSHSPATPVNNPPVANDDTATTTQGLAVQIAVLDNDSDPDGDPLTVGAVTQPANGSVTINPDGTITYTPDEDFVGNDSFTYQASDGDLLSDPATVTVTVEQAEPVNNPPVANDDTATTTQGLAVQIAVLDNDSDPDGDPLTVGAVTQPANGSVTINPDGTITYTPDEDFVGNDSFTYQASDGDLLSDPATVTVTVEQAEPVNNPPVANDDTATTTQGLAVQIAVLDNDSDPDGDPLTVGAVTQPANGSVTINPDGTITYTPDEDFVGNDSFTYQASDGDLLSEPATVWVTVEPAEEPPPGSMTLQFQHGSNGYFGVVDTYLHQSQPDTSRASSTTLVVDSVDNKGEVQALLRFDDIIGSASGQIPLGATILSATLVVQTTSKGDGATLHRMLLPWSDSATWNSLESGIQADGIEAMIPNDLDTGFIPAGTTQLDVTASLQAWVNGQANHGWAFLPLGPDGWKFHSAEGSTPPTLIVEYSTASGGPVNNAPVAQDDSASTTQGLAVQIAVLDNDSDPDGDPLTVGAATQPSNGSVTINPDGTITYTPDTFFIGSDSFTYRAYDGLLLSDPATVSITVIEGDGPPPLPLETSYIATAFNTSDRRNFEHTNATKSFYHDGDWWGVLPEVSGWHVYRFDGPLPDPGTMGGWTKSSPTMLTSGRRADIAWDNDTDTLYVINFGPSESSPRLYKMGYDISTRTFDIEANIQLAGEGGKLTGAEWQRNTEMSLGLDQNGSPVVAIIGPSAAGGEKGLKLAYPTSESLENWSTTTIDPGPSTTSGSNGDNKVDFVAFRLDGIDHVGLVYGDDATGLWKLAYQPTPSSAADYGSGWVIDTITDAVVLDNHLAALWDGTNILMTMKDDKNAIWAVKGLPENWEDPVVAHSASQNGSRPTLAYDEDNEMLFVFYQENTNRPYGDIYFKTTLAHELIFDAQDAGTRIVTSTRADENMSDPQMPYHAVGAATDGTFFVFARNQEAREIWYNDLQLSDDWLVA